MPDPVHEPSPTLPAPQTLLEELEWVRRLARRLVDRTSADDVAQEVLLVSIEGERRGRGAPRAQEPARRRAWLARVARNLALERRRSEARRRAREERAARPEASAGVSELLARAALHRELVEEVQRLPEPVRTVVLLRFFDERRPEEIARQLGVPASTVRSRLARGLDALRDRLDRRHGRAHWTSALLALGERGHVLPLPILSTVTTAMGIKLLSAVGAAVVAAIVLLLLAKDPAPRASLPSSDPSPAVAAPGAPRAPQGVESVAAGAAEPMRRTVEPAPPDDVAVAAPPARGGGLVRLLHPDGRVEEGLDGEVALVVWRDDTGTTRRLPVVAGRFDLELEGPVEVEVGDVVLDGAPAVPVRTERLHPLSDEPLVVEVVRTTPLVLEVVDRESGLHLDRVTVLAAPPGLLGLGEPRYPGPSARTLAAGARSPVTILPDLRLVQQERTPLLVAAEGYAWQPVVVDARSGGVRRVELGAGAAVDVHLLGAEPPQGAVLRARGGGRDEEPYLERALDGGGPLALERLVPGNYELSVELGPWWREPRVLARREVVAAADARAQAVLTVEAAGPSTTAPLAGVLVLHEHWRAGNEALTLERRDSANPFEPPRELPIASMQRTAPDSDVYLWDAGPVEVGRYVLALPEPFTYVVLDVGPQGLLDARLEVPGPGTLLLEVVDESSGAVLEDASVSWRTAPRGEGVGGRLERAERDEATGRAVIVAPMGDVAVRAHGRFVHDPAIFRVGPGVTTATLRVRPTYRLSVVMLDGETPVPFPAFHAIDLVPVDGDGQRVAFGADQDGPFVDVDRPGRYRFTVPEVAGYAPVEPQEVELLGSEKVVVTVRLERR